MDKVKETLAKIGNFFKSKFSSLSKKTIIIISAAVAVLLVSAITLAAIMSQVHYEILFSGASASEATEIVTYARETLGITDIKINANGDILVPDTMVEEVRVSMSIAGYPKSTFNYTTWQNGVTMFSTDKELRELQKQQLQDNLMATLRTFTNVDNAIVILGIPESTNYVLSESRTAPSAGVTLILRDTLTPEQIDGMYNLVANSVPGLKRADITITDQNGIQLTPEKTTDTAKEEEEKLEIYYQRLNYRNRLREEYEAAIEQVMLNTFDGINVSVGLNLDFDKMVTEITQYNGANVDENGHQSGIESEEHVKSSAGGLAAEGGLVGTAVDADISPDYPTLEVGDDGEFFQEYARDIYYLVDETKRQIEKDGYSIATLSAAVVVRSNNDFTGDEEMRWRRTIANAIGADVDNVSIKTTPFIETTNPIIDSDVISVSGVSSQSMVMIAIITILGIILIVLLILALNAPGSRKKRRSPAHLVAAPIPAADGADGYGYAEGSEGGDQGMLNPGKTDDTEFELTSLSEEMPETRDEALKREIQDFSKNNPEIVAQLIRSWIRGDE
ncbi:MAG: hypothetical protein NC394_05640 [Bacteroides sp.]|nr:hypothetical protein [Bacteroides sp.]